VEGILAFAERVLPRAADLWVQASIYLRTIEDGNEGLVDQTRTGWNQLALWLRRIETLMTRGTESV